jgi:hypothetical protein
MSTANGNVIIIKAGNCGHCRNLTPQLPDISKKLRENGYDLVVHEVPIMWEEPKGAYPNVLGIPGWYPFMFYVDKSTWEEIKKGKDYRHKLNICNGTFDPKTKSYTLDRPTKYAGNITGILQWLQETGSGVGSGNNPTPVVPEERAKPKSVKFDKELNPSPNENLSKINIVHRKKYGRNRRR